MANVNLEKRELRQIDLYQNGERANADNLNRPLIQLRDNQIDLKEVLDKVVDLLSSDDIDIDTLQEVADFLRNNEEAINDLKNLLNNDSRLRLDNRLFIN